MSNEQNEQPKVVHKKHAIIVERSGEVLGSFVGLDCEKHAELFRAALASKQVPEAVPQGDPLEKLTRMSEDLGLYDEAVPQAGQSVMCNGPSCKAIDGVGHSPQCVAEHERIASGLDTAGNRHPEYRYAGYKGEPLQPGATQEQEAAWQEGCAAAQPPAPPALDGAVAQGGQWRTSLDVVLSAEEGAYLWDAMGEDRAGLSAIRLQVGDGHSGHGLYVSEPEYPEDGALFVCRIPAPPAQHFEEQPDGTVTAVEPEAVQQKYDDVLLPFLALMRRELHANSGKGDRPGWLRMDANTALLEVYHHLAKLQKAVRSNDGPGVQEHAADVANMSMMVLDVCGGLDALALASAPPAPPALVPLTIEQREAVFQASIELMEADHNLAWRHAVVQATEAAHDIGTAKPAQPDQSEQARARVPADVVQAAQRMKSNDYAGPLAWARKVIDWVAAQPARGGDR